MIGWFLFCVSLVGILNFTPLGGVKRNNMSRFAVILPCYNAADTIGDIVDRCRQFCDDVIVINDGSIDNTQAICTARKVTILSFTHNQGKGTALIKAFEYILRKSIYDFVITIDGDGQHAPEDIPRFVKCYEKNKSDMIIGCRKFAFSKMPFRNWFGNRTTSLLFKLSTGRYFHDTQCGYRLINTAFLKIFFPRLSFGGFETESEILMFAALNSYVIDVVSIEASYSKLAIKQSSFRKVKDSIKVLSVVLNRGGYRL
jgi:glycosyltransferase involved in cell wall biosynthesis